MPAAALLRPTLPAPVEDRDDVIQLHGVSWGDYLRVLRMRGDHSAPRICYLEGTLEIMSPSQPHERIKAFIGRLVDAWCLDRGIEMTPFGSWTLKRRVMERGVEADECYVFGDPAGKRRPDLAIEVEWSHGGLDKLAIYAPLQVREVWRFADGQLHVHVLRGERYVRGSKSHVLPDLDLPLLVRFLDRRSVTHAVRDFRAALARRR